MTTETTTQPNPVAEGSSVSVNNVPAPAPEPSPAPTPVPVTTETEPTDTPEWVQKRINELTGKRHEAERKAELVEDQLKASRARETELLAQLATRPTATPAPAGTPSPALAPAPAAVKPGPTQEEIDRMVTERAAAIAAQNAFADKCNAVADTGEKEFKDSFGTAMRNLGMIGAVGQNVPADFLSTVVELKEPHKILHHLGTHLDEATKIVKLSPTRMALELARIEASLSKPATPSGAPAPINPLSPAGAPGPVSLDDQNVSTEEWMEARDKQIAARRERYRR